MKDIHNQTSKIFQGALGMSFRKYDWAAKENSA